MEKLKIFVCAHKADKNIRTSSPYMPVQAGKALHPDLNLGFAGDNTGDNISEKNAAYSELTVIYWGAKNVKDVEYKGLCHYRRYFDIDINENNIDSLMEGYDMITATEYPGFESNMNSHGLILSTSQEDFYIFLDTLIGIHPECKQAIIDYFYNHYSFVPFTMFIARSEVYDDYCNFIFPVLFEVEKRVKPHGYSRQNRVIGYFGEWSLGLYIHCRNLHTRQVPFVMCGDDNHTRPHQESKLEKLKLQFKIKRNKMRNTRITSVTVPSDVRAALLRDGIDLKNLN